MFRDECKLNITTKFVIFFSTDSEIDRKKKKNQVINDQQIDYTHTNTQRWITIMKRRKRTSIQNAY